MGRAYATAAFNSRCTTDGNGNHDMTDSSSPEATTEAQSTPTPAEAMPAHKEPESKNERTFSQEELDRVLADRLAREREKYADYEELKSRSAELKKIEDKNKTELERLSEDAAASKWELETARTENMRLKAAVAHGIPADYMDLLGGSTEEEIGKSAERIGKLVAESRELAELKAAEKAQPGPHSNGRPRENLYPGAAPAETPQIRDAYPASWLPAGFGQQQ